MKVDQEDLRKKIKLKLKDQKKINPSFSLRSLARNLGTSPATLSAFLNGKRTISSVIARRIISNLNLGYMTDPKSSSSGFISVQEEQSIVISDWSYYAVLCLMELKDFESSIIWISKKLSLSEEKIAVILSDLEVFGLIKKKDGCYTMIESELITTEDIQNKALRSRHLENLSRAKKSLELDAVNERDFSFMTLAIAKDDLKKYKKLIRRLQDDIVKIQTKSKKNAVYEFVFQIFPVTR